MTDHGFMQRCLLCVWFRYNICCKVDGCIYDHIQYSDNTNMREEGEQNEKKV